MSRFVWVISQIFKLEKDKIVCNMFSDVQNKKPYIDNLISVCGIYQDRVLLYVATMKQYYLVLGLKTPTFC